MNTIPKYCFLKTKYGHELLIDVVTLGFVKKLLVKQKTHTLSYYDVTLITEGEGEFRIDTEICYVKPGDIIFSAPGQVRHWDTENIKDGYALIFEEEFLLTFFNDPDFILNLSYFNPDRTTSRLTLSDELYDRIAGSMREIKTEIDAQATRDTHILRAFLYEVLTILNRTYYSETGYIPGKKEGSRGYVNRFIELVNEYYKVQRSVSYYADLLCITPNYLNELIKSATGENAKSYINKKILIEAKRQLSYTNQTVSQIAHSLSYESSAYFVRFFREQIGMTPLEYRKSLK